MPMPMIAHGLGATLGVSARSGDHGVFDVFARIRQSLDAVHRRITTSSL